MSLARTWISMSLARTWISNVKCRCLFYVWWVRISGDCSFLSLLQLMYLLFYQMLRSLWKSHGMLTYLIYFNIIIFKHLHFISLLFFMKRQ
jgi:hypothetical protein